jgi:predicted MFS family arabinose efflux permease
VWAVGSGAILVAQQRRHAAPFLPLDLLRQRTVQWICATVACFAAGMFALIFLLPIQLQLVHGTSAAGAGWQMLPLTLGLVLGSMINSRIVQRTGVPTRNPPFGLGLSASGLAVLALAPPTTTVIVVAAAFVGLGFGTVMPNAQLATQTLAGPVRLGAAAALLSLTRSLGASLGTAAFGGLAFVLLQLAPGENGAVHPVPHPPAQAFHIVYGVLAVFVAIGAWAASRVPAVRLDADAAPLPAASE